MKSVSELYKKEVKELERKQNVLKKITAQIKKIENLKQILKKEENKLEQLQIDFVKIKQETSIQ